MKAGKRRDTFQHLALLIWPAAMEPGHEGREESTVANTMQWTV